jgi:hypothetical protein
MYGVTIHPQNLVPACYVLIVFSDRTKRVKDARSEAQKEIDEYKSSKDKEFKSFEEKVRLLPTAQPAAETSLADVYMVALERKQENGRGREQGH